jgi:hypothetical protein
MAGIKISQLIAGGAITSQDEIPIARAGVETYKIAANQIVTDGSNVGVGTGQIYASKATGGSTTLQFRSLSGVDGIVIGNSGNTLVVSASGQNPVKTSITGNGTTTTFAINGANSINANNYRVDIDGVLQEPLTDYTISGSNIVFNPAPPNGSKVTVVSNNLVRAYDIVPSDGSVTSNKIVDQAVITSKLTTDIQFSLVPTGAVMSFYRTTAPSGWLVCDGAAIPGQFTALIALVGANTPNLQGQFIRGLTTNLSTTSRDPLSATRVLGNVQGDAIRNITGEFKAAGTTGGIDSQSGAFTRTTGANRSYPAAAANGIDVGRGIFDASNVVPTSTENRPVNIALLYCIKT